MTSLSPLFNRVASSQREVPLAESSRLFRNRRVALSHSDIGHKALCPMSNLKPRAE